MDKWRQHEILTFFALWNDYDPAEIPQLHRWALVTKTDLVRLIKWRFVCCWCEQRMLWPVCTFALVLYRQCEYQCLIGWLKWRFVAIYLSSKKSDESAHLHRLAWVLISRQWVKYQSLNLSCWLNGDYGLICAAANALASLHIARAHMSLRGSSQSKCADESVVIVPEGFR